MPDVEAQANYSICQSELDKGETCRMLTPTLTCTDYNYTCFFKNGSTAQQGNLTTLADNIYYFNFTQTTATGYICELCDSSTREITVVEDSFFFFLFYILAWIMFAMFLWQRNQFLIFLSGAFFIVLGMFTLIYGFGNLNNLSPMRNALLWGGRMAAPYLAQNFMGGKGYGYVPQFGRAPRPINPALMRRYS